MNASLRILFILISSASLSSCIDKKKNEDDPAISARQQIMNTDKAFSAICEKEGMKNAFMQFIDSNGVLLRPDVTPVIGADAIDYLTATNDTGFTMSWQPESVVASRSGDLGYSYGIYKLIPKNADTVLYGTYVSIWKKNADGKWKFVLDSGNEGIGTEEAETND